MKNLQSYKLFCLFFVVGFFLAGCSAKNTSNSLGPSTPANKVAESSYTGFIFNGKDFNLRRSETINNGQAYYYSPEGNNDELPVELIINKYNSTIKPDGLAQAIIDEAKNKGDKLYSPFSAPNKDGKDAFYVNKSELADFVGRTIYVMKIFESEGTTYSIIYREDIKSKDENTAQDDADNWIIKNSIRIGEEINSFILPSFNKVSSDENADQINYADIVNTKPENQKDFIGKKVEWFGKIASSYSQIDGIKFCIKDYDKYRLIDNSKECDWFWAIPKELATSESPEKKSNWNGNWNEYVFKKYSQINYDDIKSDKNVFRISGVVQDVDRGVDGNNRPVPVVRVDNIEMAQANDAWYSISSRMLNEIKLKYPEKNYSYSDFNNQLVHLDELAQEGKADVITSEVNNYVLRLKQRGSEKDGFQLSLAIDKNGKKNYEQDILDRSSFMVDGGIIKFNNKTVVVYSSFSGGAHCCTTWQPVFLLNDNVEIAGSIYWADAGFLGEDDLFEKNGDLYYFAADSRFAYFYTSYSNSFFYPLIYKIDFENGKFEDRSRDFTDFYDKYYKEAQHEFESDMNNKLVNEYDFFPHLTYRTVLGVLAGKKDEAVTNFKKDFEKLKGLKKLPLESLFSEKNAATNVAEEILSLLKKNRDEIYSDNIEGYKKALEE